MQGRPAPAPAITSLRWSPIMMARSGLPPASASVACTCAGSGLRVGKLSPPPTAANRPARPSAPSSAAVAAAGLLVQTASRQPAASSPASTAAMPGNSAVRSAARAV